MLHYILQVIVFQLIFLLMYELLLKKETFFAYNRFYLLLTPVLALLLPLLNFPVLQQAVPAETLVFLPEVVLGGAGDVTNAPEVSDQSISVNWWWVIYGSGILISLLLFLKKYRVLKRLFSNGVTTEKDGFRIVRVPDSTLACTFFNTIFLGDRLKEEEMEQILSHEIVHAKQKHSLDLLFFELQKILFWFNPLIYIYQSRVSTLHEFIADAGVVEKVEKKTYYQQMLNTAFSTKNISFINQFFNHSIIKKRIVMLQKSRSRSIAKFKYLVLVPLMLLMLTYVACSDDNEFIQNDSTELTNEDEILKESLRQELLQMEEEGAEFMEIANAFMTEKDKHIKSKEAFYRFKVYSQYIMERGAERQKEKGTWDAEDAEEHEKMMQKLNSQTYEDYVAFRKTQTPPVTTRTEVDESIGDVPFAVIEDVPVFPGCEDLASNDARKECMSSKITEFINKNFDTSLGQSLGLKGINRIYVQFRIKKDGEVEVMGARAPHPALQEEAKRVVNMLPEMTPGKQKGQEVGVLYSLPITFNVGE